MIKKHSFLQSLSAYLGNFFEHYDTALFGFLSSFLAPLIFPNQDPITALILTYAMIPLGMVARPFGAIFFGYVGDVYGRERALFISLSGMALITCTIAIIPLYDQIGILAPIAFALGRIIQNFLASGEQMGGAIFLLEHSSKSRHDMISSLFSASSIGGILLASGGVSILYHFDIIAESWRLLYLIGGITALFGVFIRNQMPKTNLAPSPIKLTDSLMTLPTVLLSNKTAFFKIIIASGFTYANYSIALILLNGFIPLITSIETGEMMKLNSFLLIMDFLTLPLFGWLSSKVSREKLMLAASLGVVLFSLPSFMLLQGATISTIVIIRVCFVLFGVAFAAPFHAWAQDLVAPTHRYAIISFGYSIGSQLLGGPTAAISLWIFKQTNVVSSTCLYWMLLASASTFVLGYTSKSKVRENTSNELTF